MANRCASSLSCWMSSSAAESGGSIVAVFRPAKTEEAARLTHAGLAHEHLVVVAGALGGSLFGLGGKPDARGDAGSLRRCRIGGRHAPFASAVDPGHAEIIRANLHAMIHSLILPCHKALSGTLTARGPDITDLSRFFTSA